MAPTRDPRSKWIWPLWLVRWVWFLPLTALALDPTRSVFQYGCENWSRQNGLPVSSVNAITQSSDGYIWLGTQQGLVRFDGIEFTSVQVPRQPMFVSQNISSLAAARDGGVWFGLKEGAVGRYDERRFSPLPASWVEPNMQVFALHEARDGSLWVGWNFGYARWRPGNAPIGPSEKSVGFVPFQAIYEDPSGRIWVGSGDNGTAYYWLNGERRTLPDDSLRGSYLFAIAQDQVGRIWIGTQAGLRCYDAQFHPISLDRFGSIAQVNALLIDRHGVLWIGTEGDGVLCYKNDQMTRFTTAQGLVNDHVSALYEDAEGDLWIGTRGGLTQLSDVKFPLYSATDGLPGEALGVGRSTGNSIWIATTKGISRLEEGVVTNYGMETGFDNPYIKRVWQAANGDVYVIDGDRHLLILADGKVVTRFLRKEWPVAITEDRQGVIVSYAGQIGRVSRSGFVPFEYAGAPPPDIVWAVNLWPARDGSLWVASHRGVWQIKDGTYRQWTDKNGLSGTVANWVCEDDDGTVWAGLASGIARFKGGKLQNISRNDGLYDNFIYSIIADEFGWLWFDSSAGVFRVRRQELNDFADGKIAHFECEAFTGQEAVKSNDKHSQEPTAARTKDGRIWFATAEGVVAIDPAHIPTNRIVPPVYIQRMRINDTEVDGTQVPALTAGKGDLEFRYTALSFIAPEKIHFRYMLEGYDEHWIEAGDRRAAFYTNLKPGEYTFRVMASNSDGMWNPNDDHVTIVLPPHFYQTRWFMGLGVVMVGTLLVGIYGWRVGALRRRQRKLQEMNKLLEEKVELRTGELAKTNRQLTEEISERKRFEQEAEQINKQLVVASREAGMAEVATSVLHNVGNVLNSVNVSVSVLGNHLRNAQLDRLAKVAGLLVENSQTADFLVADPKGRVVPRYLEQLAQHLATEHRAMRRELDSLHKNVEHIKDIVQMQQSYSRLSSTCESVNVTELVEDAVRLSGSALAYRHIDLVRDLEAGLTMMTDKPKVLQILVNLLRNSVHACHDLKRSEARIVVRARQTGDARVEFRVEDNGIGIAPENLKRIFTQGFTTRKDGHGYGLHSSALAAKAMSGSLSASSGGPGQGAAFTLNLPVNLRAPLGTDSAASTPAKGSPVIIIGAE